MRPAAILLLVCSAAAIAASLPRIASTSQAAEEIAWSPTVADHFLGPYVMLVPAGRLGRPILIVGPNDGVFPTQLPTNAEAKSATFNLAIAADGTVTDATPTTIREVASHDGDYDTVGRSLRQWRFRPMEDGWRLTGIPVVVASAPNFAATTIRYPKTHPDQDIRIRLSHAEGNERPPTSRAYTIDVNNNGSVTYRGEGDLPVTGVHHTRISASDAAGLIKNLTTANPLRMSLGRRMFHSWNNDTITISFGDKDVFLTSQMNIAGLNTTPDQRDLMTALLISVTGAERWIFGKTPLTSQERRVEIAADLGNEGLVRDLVSRGAPISPAALVSAADRMGTADLARALVEKGAPASDAILLAAKRADFEALETLLSIDAKFDRPTLTQAMLAAAGFRRSDLVSKLVQAGADPRGLNDRGETLLMRAASVGDPALVTFALAQGLNPNTKSKSDSRVALHFAIGPNLQSDRVKAIKLLLNAGADVDATDATGATPLMRANRYDQLAATLLAGGANANAKNKSGKTALTLGCPTPAVARLFIAAGARIREQSELSELYHHCWFDPKTREDAKDVIESLGRQLK